jgi:hypothetical protein
MLQASKSDVQAVEEQPMNGLNDRHAYRNYEVQRDQVLRRARQDQAIRDALQRAPKTPAAHRIALLNLLLSLFRG